MTYLHAFLVLMGLLVSCQNTSPKEPVLLTPVNTSLEEYFPYYEEVFFQSTRLLSDSCPNSNPDSSYFSIKIVPTDSLKADEIACIRVRFTRILSVENIEGSSNPNERIPIQATKKENLFTALYEPESDIWLIQVPNLFVESGKYELLYGFFLKKDSLARRLPFHKVECLYSVEN